MSQNWYLLYILYLQVAVPTNKLNVRLQTFSNRTATTNDPKIDPNLPKKLTVCIAITL